MREGEFAPTAANVARKATCSVRSVFQHFDTFKGLYMAVLEGDPALRRELGVKIFEQMQVDAPDPHAAAEVGEALEPHERVTDYEARLERLLDQLPLFVANLPKHH